ncbi:uncharacterized protein LOC123451943 isoform X1 [Hordeum vulgare subsp. vulgare]|nr:uncharacterized protein LOC123451943 isoform X1 [Hordeum vulgare subsp. vulgare]
MPDRLLPNPSPWSQPARSGTGSNPLLAQTPPGSYYSYPHLSRAPDPKSLLHTPSMSNAAAGAVDLARAYTPLGAELAKYPRYGLSAGGGAEQSSLGALFLNKSSSNAQVNLPGEGSTSTIDGMSHGAMQFQDSSAAQMMQRLPSKPTPCHQPAPLTDRIRVSCLNVGGELFVGDAGPFGVLCSCHQLRMSVAKFCEHAGGPAEKAGEIVLMENGMSIAHWFKYCVGVGSYVTDTKCDRPEWACIDSSPEGHRLKNLLARNTSMEKVGLFNGYGKSTGPINGTVYSNDLRKSTGPMSGTVYSNDLHNKGRGSTTVEKLGNKRDETYYRSADVHASFARNFTLLQNSETNLGLAKDHTVNAANLNQIRRPSGSPYFTASMGAHHNGNHSSHKYADLVENNFDASFCHPAPRSAGVFSNDTRSGRYIFPNKILQDSLSSASNTELKLGQSSYHQSLTALFPSAQSTLIDFQRPRSHLPSVTQNHCPRQTVKVSKNIGEHTEPPFGRGTSEQSNGVANAINRSEGGKVTDDAAKNSFISIFLSHLERNSEAIDDILKSSEHSLPKGLDGAYSSYLSKIASRQVEPRANENYSKLASTSIHTNRISDDRALSVALTGSSEVAPLANNQDALIHSDCRPHLLHRQTNAGGSKVCGDAYSSYHSKIANRQVEPRTNGNHSNVVSTSIHMEKVSDGRAPSKYASKVVHLANSHEPIIHRDCQSHLLHSQPDAGSSKICAGVPCPANCRNGNHAGDISHKVAHSETAAPYLHDKTAKGHNTFECVDVPCTHSSSRVAKIICHCRNSCSSSRECLPSFGQYDQSTLGKSIHRCCYRVQEDVSRLGFRAGHLCRTQFSNDGAPVHKLGLHELCTCSTFIPRSSLCSGDYILQPSCHECSPDRYHYRSSTGHGTNSLTKCPPLDAPNKKESGPCWDGRCCCSVVPKCLTGCGFAKHCDDGIDQSDSSLQKCKHDVQLPARCCTLGDSEKLRCSSNAQTPFLKAVSNKMTNQLFAPISERLKNVSEESVAASSPYIAVTEKKGTCRGSGVCKERPKSGFSSGSSSAVVTKFSAPPEFNNTPPSVDKYGVERNKLMIDEGSRTEKCSSSSYVPISTGCEKSLNGSSTFHLDTSKVKRKYYQISDGSTLKHNGKQPHSETQIKSRRLSCSEEHSESDDCTRKNTLQSSENGEPQPQNEDSSYSCTVSKIKRKHTTVQRNKPVKRPHIHQEILEGDEQSDDEGIMVGESNSSDEKKQVEDMGTLIRAKHQQEGRRMFVRKPPKYVSLNCILNEPNSENVCSEVPLLHSSLIATGITDDNRKSPKIAPLSLVLKKAKRCNAVKTPGNTENIHSCEEKSAVRPVGKYSFGNRDYSSKAEDGIHSSKKSRYSPNALRLRPHIEPDCKRPCIDLGEGEPIGPTDVETSQLLVQTSRTGFKNRKSSLSLNRIRRCEESANGSARGPCGDKQNVVQALNVGRYKERLSLADSCCVCRIPYLEPCNQLMECSKCFVKAHQACYGVLKVPRGQWFCRPCKTKANAQDTVCVLCGYGGGAMTRALNAQKILTSLRKGLRVISRADKHVKHDPSYASRSTSLESISRVDKQRSVDNPHEENTVSSSWTANHSSSLLVPQTSRWVHVVCGLWTPGTKCPNPTTMSAFDLSGALAAKSDYACSMCDRAGGSFMMCRDVNCSVTFHAWCAHQRGLLQSDPEGEHNEYIGFYGRCLNHATNRVNPEKECLRSNEWTCARTEGFKGRRGEGSSGSNYKKPQVKSSECSVSQEQINAWLRINGSKPCIRRQSKGWKHLVVYKSGIHGLGLYTSEFIPRGSMVIEYVGEIVGQRVADKREIDYHSGKRQQYKSVCYFFKIDKEHIIDATRKGGIARFINHSCMPNCVAKIISVKNEKKVVFFSERHIDPGEEITYDYHFNQEDEGERIPCFCRSFSCRRYLN